MVMLTSDLSCMIAGAKLQLDELKAKGVEITQEPGQSFIERMIAMIGQLLAQDVAYQAEDKSVYFRLAKSPNYGKLAHINLDELRRRARRRLIGAIVLALAAVIIVPLTI